MTPDSREPPTGAPTPNVPARTRRPPAGGPPPNAPPPPRRPLGLGLAIDVLAEAAGVLADSAGSEAREPAPAPRRVEAADPTAAVGQVEFERALCTATVIGPRRP